MSGQEHGQQWQQFLGRRWGWNLRDDADNRRATAIIAGRIVDGVVAVDLGRTTERRIVEWSTAEREEMATFGEALQPFHV